ncbi:AAA family ATPase [Candidatus Bipolaricaulota bacterium]|nr:AAA family ATPase [Candidatus Bipolaricaulota bacterium]
MKLQAGKNVVAVCGKGGVGKTVLTALMTKAIVESKRGGRFLVVDADPALGLPGTLGIRSSVSIGQVRESIIDAAKDGSNEDRSEIAGRVDYMVMESLVETADFAFLAMGRTETRGCYCSVNEILRESLALLSEAFDTILIDGEAGLEQINRQVVGNLDTLIILTDASARSRRSVEHIVRLVNEDHVIDCRRVGVVVNRTKRDNQMLLDSLAGIGIEVFGTLPEDDNIARYDMSGRPLLDLPSDSPAVVAARTIVESHVLG